MTRKWTFDVKPQALRDAEALGDPAQQRRVAEPEPSQEVRNAEANIVSSFEQGEAVFESPRYFQIA